VVVVVVVVGGGKMQGVLPPPRNLKLEGWWCAEGLGGVVEREQFDSPRRRVLSSGPFARRRNVIRGPVCEIDTSSSFGKVLLSGWCVSVDFEREQQVKSSFAGT
jgi:hypothetical protein